MSSHGDRPDEVRMLPHQRSFSVNLLLSLAAMLAPAAFAAAALPSLYASFGIERLGALTLVWGAIGAVAFLDVGIGRSLTHETAARIALGRPEENQRLVSQALVVLAAFGAASGAAIAAASTAIVGQLNVSPGLTAEMTRTLLLVAAATPFVVLSASLRGVLEAYGRFDVSSVLRIAIGATTYLAPLLAASAAQPLTAAVAAIVVARIGLALVTMTIVRSLVGGFRFGGTGWANARGALIGSLWMTTASAAGAALAFVDKFVLGAIMSLASVAFYATPQELVGRVTLIPMAISGVLFPTLSAAAATRSPQLPILFWRGLGLTFACLFPVAAISAALAPEWLHGWLGAEFSLRSRSVVQWLSVSVLFQGLAVTPLNLLQAAGHARTTAILQVIQLPLFTIALWVAVNAAGIEGAAIVWAVRTMVDLIVLQLASRRRLPGVLAVVRFWWGPVALGGGAIAAMAITTALPIRIAILMVALTAYAVALPRLLGEHDFRRVRQLVGALTGSNV